MFSKNFIGLLFLFVLYGCTTYQPRPVDPVQTAADFEGRTLNNPGLKEFIQQNLKQPSTPWPPTSWDLEMLTLAAFYYHPDLDLARAEWAVAKAEMVTAGARPKPDLGTIFQYNANAIAGISPWTLGFNFNIPIETAGKRGYRIAQTAALTEATRLRIAFTAWQVRSRVRANLIDLRAAEERQSLLKQQLDVQENFTRLLEQRYASGMAALPILTDARIALAKTRLSLEDALRQAAEARVQLAESIGLTAKEVEGIQVKFDFTNLPPEDFHLDGVRKQTLVNRPDILAGLAEYDASQSALQLEIAKQYPDIHLGPGYLWDQEDNKWFIGLTLTLPLFNRNEGPIAEAEARRSHAAARFIALQARVIGEIDRALTGYASARQTYKTAQSIANAEQKRLALLQSRAKVGEAGRFTLVNAKVSFLSAELGVAEALVKAHQALGSIEDAIQRPIGSSETVTLFQEADPRIPGSEQ